MSRSYLRNKYMRKCALEYSKMGVVVGDSKNKHKRDEVPKNRASKSITKYYNGDIENLNRPTYCSGHSTNKGRRMVSGLVRAAKKRETQRLLKEEHNG